MTEIGKHPSLRPSTSFYEISMLLLAVTVRSRSKHLLVHLLILIINSAHKIQNLFLDTNEIFSTERYVINGDLIPNRVHVS